MTPNPARAAIEPIVPYPATPSPGDQDIQAIETPA
jgi:hypothetical protein